MPDHAHHEDAAGAGVMGNHGDAPVPAALRAVHGLGARLCGVADIDVYYTPHPADVLHVPADAWAAFVAKTKAGQFDHLVPDELKPPAGDPPVPGRAP